MSRIGARGGPHGSRDGQKTRHPLFLRRRKPTEPHGKLRSDPHLPANTAIAAQNTPTRLRVAWSGLTAFAGSVQRTRQKEASTPDPTRRFGCQTHGRRTTYDVCWAVAGRPEPTTARAVCGAAFAAGCSRRRRCREPVGGNERAEQGPDDFACELGGYAARAVRQRGRGSAERTGAVSRLQGSARAAAVEW